MRLFVVLAAVATAGPRSPALACPQGARCIREAPSADEELPAPKRPVSLRIDHVAEPVPWTFDAPPKPSGEEMPWLWQVLRRGVYDQLPRYRDESLTFVLSPVVVTGSFDTVPGVGIAGDF